MRVGSGDAQVKSACSRDERLDENTSVIDHGPRQDSRSRSSPRLVTSEEEEVFSSNYNFMEKYLSSLGTRF